MTYPEPQKNDGVKKQETAIISASVILVIVSYFLMLSRNLALLWLSFILVFVALFSSLILIWRIDNRRKAANLKERSRGNENPE